MYSHDGVVLIDLLSQELTRLLNTDIDLSLRLSSPSLANLRFLRAHAQREIPEVLKEFISIAESIAMLCKLPSLVPYGPNPRGRGPGICLVPRPSSAPARKRVW